MWARQTCMHIQMKAFHMMTWNKQKKTGRTKCYKTWRPVTKETVSYSPYCIRCHRDSLAVSREFCTALLNSFWLKGYRQQCTHPTSSPSLSVLFPFKHTNTKQTQHHIFAKSFKIPFAPECYLAMLDIMGILPYSTCQYYLNDRWL